MNSLYFPFYSKRDYNILFESIDESTQMRLPVIISKSPKSRMTRMLEIAHTI